jgi:NAD(P)-dependent dehydrogenase (short-subunit alcohol dehydrogenase family)
MHSQIAATGIAGQVALVTGAAGALGSEVARTLAAAGARLVLADAAPAAERLQQLATEIGGGAVVAGDITLSATWADAAPRIAHEVGGLPSLAALIAGAWRGGKALHAESSDDIWEMMMQANLATVYRTLRFVLPSMVSRQHGSIVVVGARAAVQPWTSTSAAGYATSKAAVVALAQVVAAEVLAHGVRVNAVMPSTMDTPANRSAMPQADPAEWVSLQSAAGVIAFLLGDGARDISGAAVPVYGRS